MGGGGGGQLTTYIYNINKTLLKYSWFQGNISHFYLVIIT